MRASVPAVRAILVPVPHCLPDPVGMLEVIVELPRTVSELLMIVAVADVPAALTTTLILYHVDAATVTPVSPFVWTELEDVTNWNFPELIPCE